MKGDERVFLGVSDTVGKKYTILEVIKYNYMKYSNYLVYPMRCFRLSLFLDYLTPTPLIQIQSENKLISEQDSFDLYFT